MAERIRFFEQLRKRRPYGATFCSQSLWRGFVNKPASVSKWIRLHGAGNRAHRDIAMQADWVVDLGPDGGGPGV